MALFPIFRRKKSSEQVANGVTVDLFDDDFLRQLDTLSLMSRRATAGVRRGERKSRKKGSGVEFADHRNYVPGDDIRFLDIGVYQRFGKLLLRLFQEEEDLSLFFLIDTSASMGVHEGRKLNQAARVTAALAYIGLQGLDRVSVISLGEKVVSRLPATRGKQRVFRILRFLSELKATGRTNLDQALKSFVAQNKRRGLAILLTDLFDPHGFESGLNVLRFNKFDVVVLQLLDKRDSEPNINGDLKLVDVETGREREVTMTPALRDRLAKEARRRQKEIVRYCGSRGVPHFAVDVDAPFEDVVLSVLRGGGLLR